jgi:hypothetical protein
MDKQPATAGQYIVGNLMMGGLHHASREPPLPIFVRTNSHNPKALHGTRAVRHQIIQIRLKPPGRVGDYQKSET